MGVYNPHAPHILGQEWVPVRDEFYAPDIFRELGYGFTTTASRVITSGRFYMNTNATVTLTNNPAFLMSVYPAGLETVTGPVGRVLIPVSSGSVSGGASSSPSNVAAALSTPDGSGSVNLAGGGSVFLNFGTLPFAPLLNGKRILRINFIGNGFGGTFTPLLEDTNGVFQGLREVNLSLSDFANFTINAGEVTFMWTTSAVFPVDLQPWRWSILDRMSNLGSTPRITMELQGSGLINYLAMEVYYCEETRVATGAVTRDTQTGTGNFGMGMNLVFLRGVAYNYPVTLAAGVYTVTLNMADYDDGQSF